MIKTFGRFFEPQLNCEVFRFSILQYLSALSVPRREVSYFSLKDLVTQWYETLS